AAPTTTTTAPAPPPAPPFRSSVETVTVDQLGASWRPNMGCPAPEQLRRLVVSHWGYDGRVHQGRIVVAASHADRIVAVFRDIYAARFPIERMVPIDAYGGDDQASMRHNNTSGFNCRYVAGTTRLSQHGLGLAIDVNPLMNPYVKGGTVDPPEGAPYADRSRTDQGMIKAGDAVVTAFARQGWPWGGNWASGQDYQHFSASGR
ncbi:MAG: M15 family metallopeptidase, partial [Acidimicrobiales bacterium]